MLMLLINPEFTQITYFSVKPKLLIAVDNSESVAYLGEKDKTRTFVNALQQHRGLNDRFELSFFSFGKDLIELDTLAFDERQTNPSPIFERFAQVYHNVTAPLLLITDGNQTYGNDYGLSAQKFEQPIFPVILGDTIRYTDLKIEQLNVNKYAFIKNKFPVEIIAIYNGEEEVTTELIISSGNTTVFNQKISFNKEKSSRIISLNLPANKSGVHSYKAQIKPVPHEKNVINNVKNFAIEVIDRKTKVAIVSDIIHPDLRALKKAIESNEQREATILKPKEYVGQSSDFNQIIIYQPNQKFMPVYEVIKNEFVNSFTILGTKTNWSEFNTLQSNVQQTITNQHENFRAILNPDYNAFIVEDLNFSDFPPLQTEFGATVFTIPMDALLYKTINGIQVDEPLLATYEVDQKRAAVLNGEGIWRWRAQDYLENGSFHAFDSFIGQIVQYLATTEDRNRLKVSFETFYNGNDDVVLNAQYFNKNYEFDPTAHLEITLRNKVAKQIHTYPFILKHPNYQVDLSGIKAGEYDFKVKSQDASISDSGEFTILEYNVEEQFLNANVSTLQRVAASNGGKAYFIDDSNALIDQLMVDERFAAIQKSIKNSVPLIDWKFLLAIIAMSLSFEWFIRKYHGLT